MPFLIFIEYWEYDELNGRYIFKFIWSAVNNE